MTEKQFNAKMQKLQRKNQVIEYKRKLREEQFRLFPKLKLPSTSKIVLIVSAMLCVEILVFCQYVILTTGDTNALYAMVGSLFTFMGIVIEYMIKSCKENSKHGVVYETAMASLTKQHVTESTGAVG